MTTVSIKPTEKEMLLAKKTMITAIAVKQIEIIDKRLEELENVE